MERGEDLKRVAPHLPRMNRSASPKVPLRGRLSVLDGVAIMVGIVVGIGIFATPSLVAANVDSEFAFMAAWVAGGLVTLIGALCYAELAAAYPSAGGEYHFLTRAYGRAVGILFGWARSTVIQTGAIAAVAFVFGEYAQQLVPIGSHGAAIHAAMAVTLLTGINVLGTTQTRLTQVVFTSLTLAALLTIIAAGFMATGADRPEAVTSTEGSGSGAIGMAMVFVLLTYGGWNEAAYLSGDMRDTRRGIIRVLTLGTAVIATVYLLVNLAYLRTFGLEGLRATEVVAADLMRIVAGEAGAVALSVAVCVMALSTLNGTIFTGGRTYFALGRDIPSMRRFAEHPDRDSAPVMGLMVQGLISLALIAFGGASRRGFQAMVEFTAPVFWFFILLVGAALIVLRIREPRTDRPFSVPLYPVLPLLFCAVCAGLVYSSVVYSGMGSLLGIAVLLAGAPLLLLKRDTRRS